MGPDAIHGPLIYIVSDKESRVRVSRTPRDRCSPLEFMHARFSRGLLPSASTPPTKETRVASWAERDRTCWDKMFLGRLE